ncbi:hypothetical protein ABZ471_46035 [Streptomyces sp. NPDC005728]
MLEEINDPQRAERHAHHRITSRSPWPTPGLRTP